MAKVLCLGDSCADIIIPYGKHLKGEDVSVSFSCGGSAANSAAALGKLNVQASFAGKAGDDLYGRQMKKELQQNGVDVSAFILDKELVSTQVIVVLDENNDRHPFLMPKDDPSYLKIYPEDLSRIDLQDVSYILTNGMMLFEKPAAESITNYLIDVHKQGIKILLDINYRPETLQKDRCYLDQVIAIADFLLGSVKDDFLPLTGVNSLQEAVKTLLNSKNVIIAHDKKGASAFTIKQECHVSSYPVKVADTLGAGDAFNAGFFYGLVHEEDLERCLRYGNAVAAICIRSNGARNTPDETALFSFLESDSLRS